MLAGRSILAGSKRSFSTVSPLFQRPGTVWLKNEQDVRKVLSNPTWSINELLETDGNDVEITPSTVSKIIKLSGLNSNLSEKDRSALLKALKQQMVFIRHLYDENEEDIKDKDSNEKVFRLIESDHNPPKGLTLQKLLKDIEGLPKEVDVLKGETEFDIRKLHPTSESPYFTIKCKGK